MSKVFEFKIDPVTGDVATQEGQEGAPFDPMSSIAQSLDRTATALEKCATALENGAIALENGAIAARPPQPKAEELRQGNEALMKLRAELAANKHTDDLVGLTIRASPHQVLEAIDRDGAHGWVRPIVGGDVVPCGGPQMCKQCRQEHDAVTARAAGEVLEIRI